MTANLALARAAQALSAYQSVDSGSAAATPASGGGDFAALLSRSLGGAVETGQQAESMAATAVSGGSSNLTQVVTAVSRAELALQTTIAVRDRVLQAYQDIIKMPI
jgi:flagellar hook-basal body complex protein FliE